MLLALMLMYNGKTHYFFMVHRGSVVGTKERLPLLDGNKLIKKYFLFVFILSLAFLFRGSAGGMGKGRRGEVSSEHRNQGVASKTKGCKIKYKQPRNSHNKTQSLGFCVYRYDRGRGREAERTSEKKELLMCTMQVAIET
jgi:hypothetical protein